MMCKKILPAFLLQIIFFLCIHSPAFSQIDEKLQSGDYVEIKTQDGNKFYGEVIERNTENIVIETSSVGKITVSVREVRQVKIISKEQIKKGKYWFENPNATRNYFGPTAIPMRKGEGYYQNFYIVFNGVNYGVTDNVTIGMAAVPLTWFSGGFNLGLTGKAAFPIDENLYVGAGAIVGAVQDAGISGIGFGVATYGTRDNNLTAGLGYAFSNEGTSRPILTLSGMLRVGRRFGLVTENWFLIGVDQGYIFSYGGRYMGEKVAIDLGFINHPEIIEEIGIGIPIVGVVINF
ncbi:MAG: hypothetical protein GY705_17165 [Bacteroidetes bacterium]|nr:hypothetical protein [Bacteroidota bacterium]